MTRFGKSVFGVIISFLGLFIGAKTVFALTYSSDVGVQFTFNPTLEITLSSADLVISNLSPGTVSDSNILDVIVKTNNITGYTLNATVGNNTTYNTRNLVHELSGSSASFASINYGASLANLTADNTWGYSYSTDNGTNWEDYDGLPLYSDATNIATLKEASVPPATNAGDKVNFKIAAKASTSQPSGEYNNVINFVATVNPVPKTLAMAYADAGKGKMNGFFKMQDMTSEICEDADLVDESSQMQAIDTRDGKIYWITKLRDGHCWMTQNLDLDLEVTPTNVAPLTSENTDLNEYGSVAYNSEHRYSCSNSEPDCSGGVITFTPTMNTLTFDSYYPDKYSMDAGDLYYASTGEGVLDSHYHIGNHYGWPAAIAADYYNLNVFQDNTYDDISLTPKNSICPAGWRLPTATSATPTYEQPNSRNEFARLAYLYANYTGDTNIEPVGLLGSPVYYALGGYVTVNPAEMRAYLNVAGAYGDYWTSTTEAYSMGFLWAHYLELSLDFINPLANHPQHSTYAKTIRCLAR